MSDTLAVARAEALFASAVQGSSAPAPGEVRRAVAEVMVRLGGQGCAVRVAGEFGEHPEVAVVRMRWAIATVAAVYERPARVLVAA